MKVENIAIKDLKPYERNAKKHDETQIKNVMESIKQFGMAQPLVVDKDNVLIIGHCRLIACKRLKMTEVPVVRMDELTQEQVDKLRLLDNKLNESEWDFDLLAEDIPTLDFSDFDIDWELPEEQEEEKEIIEDEVPEPPTEPKAKLGDLYILGNHRLICGDSTDVAVIDRLMDGGKADCVFTDPPYNMSDHLTGFANEKTKRALSTIVDFDPNTVTDTLFAINTNNYFIFTSKELIPKYFKIFEEWGFNILVWCKDNPTPMTNNTFLPDVEYLLYFYKNGRVWNNGLDVSVYKKYYNSNKMEGRKEAGNVHPTIKPIKIIADKVQICSNKNGIVVDLFGGSGSTLIACEQLNRKCYTCELDPHYIDVIIQRYINLKGTDKDVFLIKDGKKIPYGEINNG